MPRPLSRWFMNAAQAEDEEDPYTRNTSPRSRPSPAERSTSQQQQPQQRSRSRRPLSMPSTIFTLAPGRARPGFPAIFNIVRFSIYAAVLAWTFICLAIAAHFNTLLQSSELTGFIPLAIFVSIASLLIFVVLIGFSLWKKDMNPISARIELGCLGLAGTLWMALGALMVSSDAQMADVECYASEDETEPVELPGFTTETFQAQYRVLEAFALFSAILIWAFFLFLLYLILRRRSQGNPNVWFQPVTDLPWAEAAGKEGKLPAPVTARTRTQSRPSPPEKDSRTPNKGSAFSTPATTPGVTPRGGEAGLLWMPHIPKNNNASANANTSTSTNQHSAQNAAALAGYGYGGTARPPPRAYQGSYDRNDAARRQDSQRSTDSQGRRGRSTDKWGRDASPRRNDSTRSVERTQPAAATTTQRGRSQPRRDDSQRSNQAPRREDSSRSRPARGDSQRSQQPRQESRTRAVTREDSQRSNQAPRREDSSRSRPARGDSQRSQQQQQQQQPRRDESRNRTMTREDSSRSRPAREDSQRSRPVREDSQRSRPVRGDSQRSQPRRDDSQRSRPQREDSQRTQRSANGGWYREAATRK